MRHSGGAAVQHMGRAKRLGREAERRWVRVVWRRPRQMMIESHAAEDVRRYVASWTRRQETGRCAAGDGFGSSSVYNVLARLRLLRPVLLMQQCRRGAARRLGVQCMNLPQRLGRGALSETDRNVFAHG